MLLKSATKEFIADTARGSALVDRNPWQVSWVGIDGSTSGDIGISINVKYAPSLVLIGVFGTYPPSGINRILQVPNKRQSTPPALDGNTSKLDAVIDGKLPNDLD